jgi:hypothetical protein
VYNFLVYVYLYAWRNVGAVDKEYISYLHSVI